MSSIENTTAMAVTSTAMMMQKQIAKAMVIPFG
jgi:hypothetical protein